jgi:hypothetical protein
LSEDARLRPEYNDLDLVIDEDIKKRLMDNGRPYNYHDASIY